MVMGGWRGTWGCRGQGGREAWGPCLDHGPFVGERLWAMGWGEGGIDMQIVYERRLQANGVFLLEGICHVCGGRGGGRGVETIYERNALGKFFVGRGAQGAMGGGGN